MTVVGEELDGRRKEVIIMSMERTCGGDRNNRGILPAFSANNHRLPLWRMSKNFKASHLLGSRVRGLLLLDCWDGIPYRYQSMISPSACSVQHSGQVRRMKTRFRSNTAPDDGECKTCLLVLP